LLVALLAQAPLQCSREPEPDLRTYETPPEALHDLALRFKAKGDARAYRETLSYLMERYPSSRFAILAKAELAADAGAPSGASVSNQ
jgi:hypothetical protein